MSTKNGEMEPGPALTPTHEVIHVEGFAVVQTLGDAETGHRLDHTGRGQEDQAIPSLRLLPITMPGIEQKSVWLQIRQSRPDYVFLWGWGVMNSTSIKEAVATGYPREKMYGVWWSGAEPDVTPAGEGAKGYNSLVFLAPAGQGQVL